MAINSMEEFLVVSNKLFFHKPDKLVEFIKKPIRFNLKILTNILIGVVRLTFIFRRLGMECMDENRA